MESKEKPHYGRAVIMATDRAVYVRCPKLHLVERIPIDAWPGHWLRERVFEPRWEIECSIDTNARRQTND